MIRRLSACLFFTLFALPLAAEDLSIVAVVNDDIVSSLDVENRMKLVIRTSQLSDSPEIREQLKPQILRSLIDERLQLQEATAQGITVDDKELREAVGTLEAQRRLQPGELLTRLDQLGVPRSTFTEQVRAQLSWTKLAFKKLRPKIRISDDELDRERRKLKTVGGPISEVQIEVLQLPVDKPENDAQVGRLAAKLASEIKAGAPFENVAQQLSGATAANAGIKPFWIALSELDPAIGKAITDAPNAGLIGPVRTLDGYTLVKLLDKRTGAALPSNITEVVVKDILFKLKSDASQADVEVLLAIGKDVARNPGTCADKSVAGVKNLQDYDMQVNFRRDNQNTMPDGLKAIVAKLPVGGVSEPYASEEGIRLFMLCERMEKPAALADGEETMQRLIQQKLELEAQKYLRQIRREAFVEVRR